ncbi:hypothetical protein DJ86_659 [Bacillus cereus ATCC 4342]|nr:hypothetical protein [Bacillus tropicus]AJH72504.1 hypothetical protein BF35_3913 [Bacillus cereus ATCC 4342]EEK82555.1 hypothetical protein bcere0010_40270 [Bacillus cereus ATCC 4342]KFM85067.1 hypothetical protein DJ86_659 [Bacillus cereus ATCC 4342]
MRETIIKKKKPITITVRVFNEPSKEAIMNTAKILKTLGNAA